MNVYPRRGRGLDVAAKLAGLTASSANPSVESLEPRRLMAAFTPDFGLYTPSSANLRLDYGRNGSFDVNHALGQPGDQIVAADFSGTTLTGTAAYHAGTWSIDDFNTGAPNRTVQFGNARSLAVAGDIEGIGKADLAVYNPNTGVWRIKLSNSQVMKVKFTAPGGTPLLADFNNDGKADLVVYQAGTWYVDTNLGSVANRVYHLGGGPGDVPVIADFNGLGKPNLGIFNNGVWRFDTTGSGQFDSGYIAGSSSDVPVAGYFDPGNSLFVSPGASGFGSVQQPLGTITDAIDRATSGTRIRIAAGSYPENLNLFEKDNVDFIGAGQNAVHVNPSSGDAFDFDRDTNTYLYNLNVDSGARSLVVLGGSLFTRGVSTDGSGQRGLLSTDYMGVSATLDLRRSHFNGTKDGQAAVLAQGTAALIRNCTFDNNLSPGGGLGSGLGLVVEANSTANAKNCDFSGNDVSGVTLLNNTSSRIRQSTISFNRTFDGAFVSDAAAAVFRGDLFEQNGTTRDAVAGRNGIEVGNAYTGPGVVIKNNTFVRNTGVGVYLGNGAGHVVVGNTFNDNLIGLDVNGAQDNSLSTIPVNTSAVVTNNDFEVPAGNTDATGFFALGSHAAATVGGNDLSLANTFGNYSAFTAIVISASSAGKNFGSPNVSVLDNIYNNSPHPVRIVN